ncbi:methyl-accepting chemotaxis protein [Flaviflagellibacter deserti]|uniref:Methyl-accepting chemotaxis protein n=1 Tax=Flaviflagellibacter deserti TaxID=2267266 RepID=A0ABV9Z4K1_9HYPH
MKFTNLKLVYKVMCVLIAMAGVAIFGVVFSDKKISEVETTYMELVEHTSPTLVAMTRLNLRLVILSSGMYETFAFHGEDAKSARDEVKKARKEYQEQVSQLQKLDPDDSTIYESFLDDFEDISDEANKAADLAMAGRVDQALPIAHKVDDAIDELRTKIRNKTNADSQEMERKAEQAAATAESAQTENMVVSLIGLGVVFMLAVWMTIGLISRPLARMSVTMAALAGGDLTVSVDGQKRKDEVGDMAKAVDVFKQNAIAVKQLEAEQEAQKARAEAEKRAAMNDLADRFEVEVMGVVQAVSASAQQLQANAETMSSAAEETSRQSNAVAAASEQATTNVQTVAAAAEELSKSIHEIAEQVTSAATATTTATNQASSTVTLVQGLAQSAQRIGEVVGLIGDVSAQTNLLALNATIEAARAGEAGRGFAVVAQEVKQLAAQTSRATEEIASQIQAVQGATNEVVQAITGISNSISQIDNISGAIATAVEEQGAATQEIARNVVQASTGTKEVSSNISGVSEAAASTGKVSEEIVGASVSLAKQANDLRDQVSAFIGRVRVA